MQIPQTLATSTFRSGYLSREGHFYGCGYQGHYDLARVLVQQFYPKATNRSGNGPFDGYRFDPNHYLEKMGWLKVDGSFFYYNTIRGPLDAYAYPSPAQVMAVTKWFDAAPVPHLYYNNESGSTLADFLRHVQPV